MKQVDIVEARKRLSELIRSVANGEEVVIANRGEPVARLMPIAPRAEPVSNGKALADWFRLNPLPQHLQRAHVAIEADIAEQRDAWERSTGARAC